MGLLDDAIREHLDLKRRRGADPAEVERAEREALGPVRRNPSPSDVEPVEDQSASGEGFAYDQAEEEGWSHDSLQEPAAGAAEALYEKPPDERIYEEPPAAERGYDEPPAADRGYDEEPSAERGYDEPPVQPPPDFAGASEPAPEPTPPSARPLSDLGGGETQEYKVEEFLTAEDEEKPGQDDDVLEETPEFLQDTPDHDRLWFEQRPPKDFDFDE
jgi:hypothetical protein